MHLAVLTGCRRGVRRAHRATGRCCAGGPFGGTIDLVTPGTFDIAAVEHSLTEAAGRPVKATPKVPTYFAFRALQPYFHLRRHRFSSVIPLIRHFDAHGYVDDGPTVADAFPDFEMTTLDEHLQALFR